MRVDAALVREQGVYFAVVVVKSHVLDDPVRRGELVGEYRDFFPGYNVVLMIQDRRGVPTYYGRKDIVRFLSKVAVEALPWKTYSFRR